MINLFDFTSMAETKKNLRDGSIGGRNRPAAINKAANPVDMHSNNKPAIYESRKASFGIKSSTTPIKMLIAQEMFKETDSKRKAPNVIARLMGLDDAFPADSTVDSSVASSKRSMLYGSSAQSYSELRELQDSQQHLQAVHFEKLKPWEHKSYSHEKRGYRDAYEVRQRESRLSSFNDRAPQKIQNNESQNDKRMAFVREKFVEAKRLATDEKFLESKEFHDALEVLSSNRDLFLKFLEEPNSVYSSNSEEFHSIFLPPQAKRITVLKPSKTKETKSKFGTHQYNTDFDMQSTHWNSSLPRHPITEKLSQPTRIVVLKPSPRKHVDIKASLSPVISSPEASRKGDIYGGQRTREATKDHKHYIAESPSGHRRDESLLSSSVFSNGYFGDDSSMNRSENCAGEDCDISDSEIASSWECTSNRYGSPCSCSPLNRASHSPESSLVIREAKKRLSERWALVTSNGLHLEKLQGRRSSSTLGEMLAINELKMENRNDMRAGASEIKFCGREEEFRMMPAACFSIGSPKEENRDKRSNGTLSRSKTVPASSSAYESIGLNAEDSNSRTNKTVATKATISPKSKSGRTSFKGRVSSLFFLKSKTSARGESISSPMASTENGLMIVSADAVDDIIDNLSQTIQTHAPGVSHAGNYESESDQISSPAVLNDTLAERKISPKANLSHEDSGPLSENIELQSLPEKLNENRDHPSPTSTLDAPFKDDTNENASNSSKFSCLDNPQALSRSPPIESIARTLSWDNSHIGASLPASFKVSRTICNTIEDDPEDLILVQNLLIASGLDKNKLSTIYNGWHSPDTPLDPKLRDTILNVDNAIGFRMRRSNQKLVFDCVNDVLQEIGHSAEQHAYQCTQVSGAPEDETLLSAQVLPVVKKRLFDSEKLTQDEAENRRLIADKLIGSEIRGGEWTDLLQFEISAISKEIGVQILDELVGEVLVGLTVS